MEPKKPLCQPVVVIGIGEIGGELARGFLKLGHPVYPVVRGMNPSEVAQLLPEPELVAVTVAEEDLPQVLERLPERWRDRVVLVQNELTPELWRRLGLKNPTVAVIWFEKKPGAPLVDILDSPVYGPKAELVVAALKAIGVRTRRLESEEALIFELAKKSLYLLTLNCASLVVDGTAAEVWYEHPSFSQAVAEEVLALLERRFGRPLPREALIAGMEAGIDDCPGRRARGRRAKARLERLLLEAREAGLPVPTLEGIWRRLER